MRILVDTCVLSEIHNPHGDHSVRSAFADLSPDDTFLSVITLGEIRKGIALLPEGQKKRGFDSWLQSLEREYSDRTLPIESETALIWGEITANTIRNGHQLHATDGLIAATAIQHGLHVMTRNVRHFEVTGVLVINPWR